ncbi:aminomethyl-transferring glycine dehydrogenase subunit GcvPA [Proteinivorax hydrogeniformans]|uniref:Probable glycine dehydrogenase (decarboxylating) subunit 1 n=1 Tax=Proteinivorax hydrogeniformans TaxID=1826727 RepID=A0AAU8HRB6_9FIRM
MNHRFIPKTYQERKEMLSEIGKSSIEELFSQIPQSLKMEKQLDIKGPMSELELTKHINTLASKNKIDDSTISFLGGGSYDHYIPSVIKHITSRSEFYTAYTPYQAEISQGVLQSIFEFQTMISRLTNMEVSNASMYDGATAAAEAMLMAKNKNKKGSVLISKAINPNYRKVLKTYASQLGIELEEIDFDSETGQTNIDGLESKLEGKIAGVVIQSPNYFGVIEEMEQIGEKLKDHKALFIAVVDPISLAVLKRPGDYHADIAVGEGQSLGIPQSYGGPYLGFFSTTQKLMRKMPGRVVGKTEDKDGNLGFVLTLQTREQHIRRDKATSNICSNQALCALAATVYMSTMGKQGLKEAATQSLQKAYYAKQKFTNIDGVTPLFTGPTFKEFALKLEKPEVIKELEKHNIYIGVSLENDYPELSSSIISAVTEKRTSEEIDETVKKWGEMA